MSADYGTARFKGFAHHGPGSDLAAYIHVVWKATGGDWGGEAPLGNFTLAELTELAQLTGQAWPAAPGVEVRYVIEARPPGKQEWQPLWTALADDADGDLGVSEDFAEETFKGFVNSKLEWRLVRRTTLTADEVLTGE